MRYGKLIIIQNPAECEAVVQIAKHLQNQNKSYRIITPYGSQRTLIEDEMKKATGGMDWEDKCFTLDAFQGPEFCHC